MSILNLKQGKIHFGIRMIFILFTLFSFIHVSADEIGPSTCGKPILVRGDIKHYGHSKAVTNATDAKMYSEEVYGKDFTAVVQDLSEGTYTIEIILLNNIMLKLGRVYSIFIMVLP